MALWIPERLRSANGADPGPDVDEVRWSGAAQDRLKELTDEFGDSLREIGLRLARHDKADSGSVKHVDHAFDSLARLGLDSRPWWRRPQLKASAAGALATAAVSLPDWASRLPLIAAEGGDASQFTFYATLGLLVAGAVGLSAWAWSQGRA